MAVRATPIFIDGNTHPAEETRLSTQSMLVGATGSFAGGVAAADSAHGVGTTSDLAVSANATPNMTVNVAAGGAFIRGTISSNQGAYHLWNDATVSLAIDAADATNPRRDLVIAQVRDSNYSGSDDDARLVVVTGTPAAVPTDPSLSSYPNALVLARVTVAANDTAIGAGDITDLRTLANVRRKLPIVTSTTARDQFLPSPTAGQGIYLDTGDATEGIQFHNGTSWRLPWNMPWGVVGRGTTTSSSSLTTTANPNTVSWSGLSVDFTGVANRVYRTTLFGCVTSDNAAGSDYVDLVIDNGSGTNLASSRAIVSSGIVEGRIAVYVEANVTGSQTRRARIVKTGAGRGSGYATSTFQASIVVEDLGPSGTPA